ncbi:efflux RND transporter periplasmic adaptor subunit [Hymenobacter caeli]|uniref:Membrane fusion protein (Multidrug efflux system) n=1 Tax=Hymenobacter caeli TaxID=2735894 RepID=A0ABX2FLH2_9BACT|nr:efflux RND transporter periplasmic adaptor subunit [Hymenobacter caeli]NRT17342.1 membrane fusion protein (multidrug efflux system) [Hymenobacter caeli]
MTSKYLALCAALGLVAGAACGKKDADQKKNAAPPPVPVSVVAARTTDAVYYDTYPATAVALQSVEVRSQVTGFITALSFKEGELVPKGKVLYQIDKSQFQAAYQQALAGLASARASAQNANINQTRYQRLLQQDAIARQVAETAVTTAATAGSQVAAAQAAVAIARTNLGFATIRAPFAGRIGISQVRLGTQVSAGTTVLNTISSENPIGVDFVVTETDIPRFTALQNRAGGAGDSTLRFVLPGGQPYGQPGKIRAIARGVDAQTGTITVRLQFANPRRELKDGLSGVVKVLNTQSGNHLVIPNQAVVEQMGENFVYVAAGDSASQRKVQLGPRLADQVVVLNGIKAGDKIVTEGVQKLRDGGKIKISAPGAAVAK